MTEQEIQGHLELLTYLFFNQMCQVVSVQSTTLYQSFFLDLLPKRRVPRSQNISEAHRISWPSWLAHSFTLCCFLALERRLAEIIDLFDALLGRFPVSLLSCRRRNRVPSTNTSQLQSQGPQLPESSLLLIRFPLLWNFKWGMCPLL